MAKQINRVDVVQDDVFKSLRESAELTKKEVISLQTGLVAINESLKLTKEEAKALKAVSGTTGKSNTSEIQKTIELQKEVQRLSKQNETLLSARARTTEQLNKKIEQSRLAEIRLQKAREKAFDDFEKKLAKQASTYNRTQQQINRLTQVYNELATRKERYNNLTDHEEMRLKTLQRVTEKYNTTLKNVDASIGRHGRNVGNYASGFNGLQNSISQVAREMPAFANSMQTGFMAISNNLPILFDEISRVKQANLELASTGQPVTSVFKQVASSILSPMMALNAFVILLTAFGPKLADWIGSMFEGSKVMSSTEKEAKKLADRQKYLNEQAKKSREYVASESAEYVGYLMKLKATTAGSKERSKIISEINQKYGTTLKNMRDEAKFQSMINVEVVKYIQYKQAEFRLKSFEEKITLNLEMQQEAQKRLNDARKNALYWNSLVATSEEDLAGQGTSVLETQDKANEKVKEASEELETLQKHLEHYGYGLLLTEGQLDKFGKKQKKETQNLHEFNVELSKFDEISARINERDFEARLRFEIGNIADLTQLDTVRQVLEGFKKETIEGLIESGQYVESELFRILNDEYDLRAEMITKQNAFEVEQLSKKLSNESALRLRDIEEEKKEKEKEINETEKQLRAEGKLTAEQQALINKARIDLERNYQTERKKISEDISEQDKLTMLEIEKANAQMNKDLAQNDRERLDAINSTNEELYKAELDRIEKEKEAREKESEAKKEKEKEDAEFRNDIYKLTTDYFIEQSQKRVAQIEKEIQASQKQFDFLQEKAKLGTITAKESLAQQQADLVEANRKKERELRKQEILKLSQSVYDTYAGKVESGSKNPVGETIKDVVLLKSFISSLSSFFDGTIDTGSGGGLDGRGGFLSVLHPNERVVPKKENVKLNRIPNEELPKAVDLYTKFQHGDLPKVKTDTAGNSFDLMPLLSEFKELKQAVRENNIGASFQEVSKGVAWIGSNQRKGNDLITNKYLIRK